MAELLLRIKEKNDTDLTDLKHINGRFHTGDVITIQDDGWSWGEGEKNSLEHIIIKIPGLKKEDLFFLYAPYTIYFEGNNLSEKEEELRTEIRKLGLNVSLSVDLENLKDIKILPRMYKIKVDDISKFNFDNVENKLEMLTLFIENRQETGF